MNILHKGIVTLLRAAITGEKLSLPQECSLEELVSIAIKQSVGLLAYQGALNCGVDQNTPVMQKLLMNYYRHLMINEHQMRAVQEIFDAFDEAGISYMPVKGCIMKKLYPKPELRSMGDADILIRPQEHDRIRPVMEKLGFEMRRENEHVFEWNSKRLHVELHKSLVPPVDEDYYAYYGTGWELAGNTRGTRYDLSVEDAYVFLFSHFARHYRSGGIGCRHVADLFVYRRAYPELDWAYINGELEKLRLRQFHDNMAKLLEVWFSDREPDAVTELMTAFIFSGGSWGSMEASMYAQEIKAAARAGGVANSGLRSALRAVFPARNQLAYRYHAVIKYPALLPVFWVVRWIDILFFRPQKIRRRLRILRGINDAEVLDRSNALEAVGLGYHFGDQT